MSKNKPNYKHTFIKHKSLVCGAYLPIKKPFNKTALVIAQGAISPGDVGRRKFHETTIKHGIPVFIPDYYGHSRSGGTFSPKNCAKTIIDMVDYLKKGVGFYDVSENKKIKYKFEDVLVVGCSFGGWVPWYINHFFPNNKLEKFGLISPFVDFKNQASKKFPNEESIDYFLREGREIYKKIYRGMEDQIWDKFLFAKNKNLDPMENLGSIADSKIVIIHGKKDKAINYTKSVKLHKKLLKINPQNKTLKIFDMIDHDGDILAVEGGMDYILKKLVFQK